MASTVKITDQKEMEQFVRTHMAHRLTAMVAPICLPEAHNFWTKPSGRNDAYRAAKEGSYSMLRLFIEFLGVKANRKVSGKLCTAQGDPDTILLDAFSKWGVQKVEPNVFGPEESLIAEMHLNLCKINAHFTYDQKSNLAFYDRISSPDDDRCWRRAVEVVVAKLDEHFYDKTKQSIIVHFDVVTDFNREFVSRLKLKSSVKGDGLGRP